MPRAHGAIMKAARADHQALNGETLYRAGERMAASRLAADVDGTATSPGRNDTNREQGAEGGDRRHQHEQRGESMVDNDRLTVWDAHPRRCAPAIVDDRILTS